MGTWGYFWEYILDWLYIHLGDLLPRDIILEYIEILESNPYFETGVKWFNWLFPMGSFLRILAVILSLLGTYYAGSVLLRHFRVIH